MMICYILITKQLILCEYYKENLHTDKQSGTERVKSVCHRLDGSSDEESSMHRRESSDCYLYRVHTLTRIPEIRE